MSGSSLRGAERRSNPGAGAAAQSYGLLRFARNDGEVWPSRLLRGLGGARRALREAALEHALGDAVAHHLERAAGDHPGARLAEAVLDQAVLRVAGAAEDLHGLGGDVEAGLVAEQLCHRGVLRVGQAGVGAHGGAVEQQLAGVELDPHVGELPLQALELAQRAAELLARARMLARQVEAEAAERQRARGVADT